MTNWLEQVRRLPRDRRVVQHEPETPRYARALVRLDYLLEASSCLGTRVADVGGAVEFALWAPPPAGRGPGFYSCIRAFRDTEGQALYAVLFCFWDGTEGSRGFRSIGAARAHARGDGFEVNDAQDQD